MLQMLIRMLDLGNFIDVFYADGSRDLMTRSASPFFNTGCFFEKIRSRRRFSDKGKCAVRLNGDQCGCWYSWFYVCGPCIEFFAKVHRFDATSTKSGTDRWGWSSLPGWNQDALMEY